MQDDEKGGAAARDALFGAWTATSGLRIGQPEAAALRDRASFRALQYGLVLIDYGRDIGDGAIRAGGEYALRAGLR